MYGPLFNDTLHALHSNLYVRVAKLKQLWPDFRFIMKKSDKATGCLWSVLLHTLLAKMVGTTCFVICQTSPICPSADQPDKDVKH